MTTPDRKRTRLPGISSRAYEHPADRSALVGMRSLTGFDIVLRRLSGLFRERSLRLMFLGSSVRVGDRQFRNIYDMVRDAAYILDLDEVPELYVISDPRPNAMTLGSDKPFIVLTSGMIDLLDDAELRFCVSHEVGHVLSGHAVYRTMLYHLIRLAARVAWIPLGYIGIRAIVTALEEWERKSELSADRAGLLAGQDLQAAQRALMKTAGGSRLAEMDVEAFAEQAREYDAAGDVRDGLAKLLNLQGTTHPLAVVRLAELVHWADSGEYDAILGGDYPRRADDAQASVTDEVKAAARSYRDSWNRSSDPLIGTLRDVAGSAAGAGERIFGRFTGGGGGGREPKS
ncbi:MAG: M48 family metalloprotease [Streptosporangiales bacterium]|nr:M48 family metalloprotease [Streptosporangiales bacterium]